MARPAAEKDGRLAAEKDGRLAAEQDAKSVRRRRHHLDGAYWALWIIAILLYLAWPAANLTAYAWSNDEGLYVQQAALANAGYRLYAEVLLNKPPLQVWILQTAFRAAGQSLATARLATLGLTLIGFVALGAVARQLWGRWAGLATVALFLGLPEVPVRAHAVMSDLPAMAFGLVALWAALQARRAGRRRWVVLSGAAFAGGLLIHPLVLHLGLPLVIVLLIPEPQRAQRPGIGRRPWLDLAVFAGVAASAGLLALALIDRPAFFTWALSQNIRSVGTDIVFAGSGAEQMLEYVGERWTLVLLAASGALVLLADPVRRRGLIVPAAWAVAAAASLAAWAPVWVHYMLVLALPLAVAAGGGISVAAQWGVDALHGRRTTAWWRLSLAGLVLLSLGAFALQRLSETMPQPEGGPAWSAERTAARSYLKETTSPDALIVTDDPLLAFTAGRLVLPTLTEASYKQIRLGHLATEDVVRDILHRKPQAALFATGRLALLPGLEDWVATMSVGHRTFGEMRAYQLDPSARPEHRLDVRLDETILLTGYTLSADELVAGETLTVTLFWMADGPVTNDYTAFLHLKGQGDTLVAQHDGPPLMGAYPTSRWIEGILLPDRHVLTIAPEAAPGTYDLLAGMYGRPSLERLPAYDGRGQRWPDDVVTLGTVRVISP